MPEVTPSARKESSRIRSSSKAKDRANSGMSRPASRAGVRTRQGWLSAYHRTKAKANREASVKQRRKTKRKAQWLRQGVFSLVGDKETECLARQVGFYWRTPRGIRAFDFALCCALASVVEHKRGFASVWRLLATCAGIELARSAVTQRFGPGSAALMEALFFRAIDRVPAARLDPNQRTLLNEFRRVLAQDGTVLQLMPVLASLYPATRTNAVAAAAKGHVTADVRSCRVVDITLTGERASELGEFYRQDIEANSLYLFDLGYTSYDLLWDIVDAKAWVVMGLKSNANPTVVAVRHGVRGPRRSVGAKFRDLQFCRTKDSFDLDAKFWAPEVGEYVTMRIVGLWNPETQRYHCYITNLPPQTWTIEKVAALYQRRWNIELLMKLLKSGCHLDHIRTGDPDALRTLLYASLLASVILHSLRATAANAAGLPLESISFLMVGIAAPLLAAPLLLLWLEREISYDELAAMMLRCLVIGCLDQNPGRTRKNADALS